jgi:CubicO group peptidase (beta-lactamase class C family)
LRKGWTAALRALHPHERIYTFWKYFRNAFARDAGLRIDHLLLSPLIANRLVAAGVDRQVRGREHASDHAPAWIEIADAKAMVPRRGRRFMQAALSRCPAGRQGKVHDGIQTPSSDPAEGETDSSNPIPSSGEMLWGGRRGWQFRRLHQSMECRDAPAERFEQVPRRPGPK